MKAIVATRFGEPEVLEPRQVGEPVAGEGEVVVDVAVADVLFVDTQIRRGLADWFPVTPPYVPGFGLAGHVRSVGASVPGTWLGQRVVATTGSGGYAEQARVSVHSLVPVPDALGLDQAAALLHDGRTAVGLLRTTPVRPGEWVLVTAAGGGLGLLLVQLARAAGAHVVAAAGHPRKLRLARTAGAEVTIDYTATDWAEKVRDATGGAGPHVVFDGAGGEIGTTAFNTTAVGGRFSAHGAASGTAATTEGHTRRDRRITVRGIEQVQFTPTQAAAMTGRALAEAAAGRLTPLLGHTLSLDCAAAAHTALEQRTATAKTLLRVDR